MGPVDHKATALALLQNRPASVASGPVVELAVEVEMDLSLFHSLLVFGRRNGLIRRKRRSRALTFDIFVINRHTPTHIGGCQIVRI